MLQRYDLSYLQEVSKGNLDFMLDMIGIFLTKTPETLAILESEIEKKNWELVGFYAHKLKATYAYMGINDLRTILYEIEQSAKKLENLEDIPNWFATIKKQTSPAIQEITEHKKILEASI